MAKVLVGFMGAGKSTIARLLDDDFIDMDDYLTQEIKMPIHEYFERYGEAAFRQIESQVLERVLELKKVVSTGGGVVVSSKNRQLLKENKETIFLKIDFECAYQRIEQDVTHQRPLYLSKTKAELEQIFTERQKWYEEVATKIIDVTQKTPDEIVEELQ